MTGALTRKVDFSSFTTTSSVCRSSSSALLKRTFSGWAVATLSTGLAFEMSLPTVQQDTSPVKVVPRNMSQQKYCLDKLPIQYLGISSFPLTWHCECVSTLISWTPTSITAQVSATTHFPAYSHAWVKKYSQTAIKLFPIHFHHLHQPLAVISFLVLLPAGCISLLFLVHFKLPGTTIFLFSVHTVPSTARYQTTRKALDITICQIRGIWKLKLPMKYKPI